MRQESLVPRTSSASIAKFVTYWFTSVLAAALIIIAMLVLFHAPARADQALIPSPAPTPRQLGMTGDFVVAARNGLIRMRPTHDGHWARTTIPVVGPELDLRLAEARQRGRPVIDLAQFDLVSAAHRVDSLRLLNETSWSALATIVAFRLDEALATGTYKFILLSDEKSYVLMERSGGARVKLQTVARISGEAPEAFLKRRGFSLKAGYAMSVPELTQTGSGSDRLLMRLENDRVAGSALLEKLVASRS